MSVEDQEPEECCGCGSKEIEAMSYHFAHKISETENHLLCKKCLIEFTKICTCSKEFKQEPKLLMVYCPCSLDQEPTKTFHSVNTGYFLEFLEQISDKNYFYISGCRGICKYTDKEICNNYNIALKAAVEACVYEKKDQGQLCSMSYVSDALDPAFIEYAKSIGVDLGSEFGQCKDL